MSLLNYFKNTKAVIFDGDGVIVDSTKTAMEVFQKASEKKRLKPFSDEKIKECWGYSFGQIAKKIWKNVTKEEVEELKQEMISLLEKTKHPPFDGVINCLNELKKAKFPLILLTNREYDTFHLYEKVEEICRCFDLILTPDINPTTPNPNPKKPDPKSFDQALDFLAEKNINKDQILFVGDTLCDLKAAQGANVKFLGVLTGACEKKTFQKHGAKYCIECATHLSAFFS
mgnify:CR=1 FL=1